MQVVRTPAEMRAWSLARKCAGRSIGFVPTMGALHEGHASLLREAVSRDHVSVLSIFVNPAQFAPNEDLDKYPRTWDADLALAEAIGVDLVYAPNAATMYPAGFATYVQVERLADGLCSRTRPHFFRGVATVVVKLFNAVLPDHAYFGQKDAQQCAVIRRMARDLDLGVEIVEMPIVRETDGLAMSSRNRYLGPEDRQRALCLHQGLQRAEALLRAGERDAATVKKLVREALSAVEIDYVELVDAETMAPLERVDRPVLLAVAAQVGPARLIDNIKFAPVD
ncbi:MAG: pantoate--beta-alanine ligase [Candidatus Hydrogenedentes bacterium]|nr:pantoate--beta-alanine ligase [Candidatus Hydrogenedentota bacterium]